MQTERVRICPSLKEKELRRQTDSIPGHTVWRCRSNRVQYYKTACCINRRLSLQQPCRQDGGPAEWRWSCQSDAALIWAPRHRARLLSEMNTMVLGVRKRRHCERGERGQTAPRVPLPLRSLCILTLAGVAVVCGLRSGYCWRNYSHCANEYMWMGNTGGGGYVDVG